MPKKVEPRNRRCVRMEILLSPIERRELEALARRWECSLGSALRRMVKHHAMRELAE